MATEVRHGATPKFRAKLSPGRYTVTVVGRYTTTPGLTAAGVTSFRFNSKRPIKRQAELLGMRTAFLCWFVMQYERLGGRWKDGVEAVTGYPFRRLRKRIVTLRRQKKKIL